MKKTIALLTLMGALLASCGGTPAVSSFSNESISSSSPVSSSASIESSLEQSSLEEESSEAEVSSSSSSRESNENKNIEELLDQLKAYNGHLQTVNDYSSRQHSIDFYGEKGILFDQKGGLIRTEQGICEYALDEEGGMRLTGVESIGDVSIYQYFYSGFFIDLISSLPKWSKDESKNRYYCYDHDLIISAAQTAYSYYWDYFDLDNCHLELTPSKSGFDVTVYEKVVTTGWEREMKCYLYFSKLGDVTIPQIDDFLENPKPLEKKTDYGFDQIDGFEETFGKTPFPFVDSFGYGLLSYIEGNSVVVFDVTADPKCKADLKEAFLLAEGWSENLDKEAELLAQEKQEIFCFDYPLEFDKQNRPISQIALSFTFTTYEHLLETAPDYAPCYPTGYFKMMFSIEQIAYPLENYREIFSDLYGFFGARLPIFSNRDDVHYAYVNSTDEMDAYSYSLTGAHIYFFAELYVLFEENQGEWIDAYAEQLTKAKFDELVPETSSEVAEAEAYHQRNFFFEKTKNFPYNINVMMELSFYDDKPNGVLVYFIADQE